MGFALTEAIACPNDDLLRIHSDNSSDRRKTAFSLTSLRFVLAITRHLRIAKSLIDKELMQRIGSFLNYRKSYLSKSQESPESD